MKRKIWSILLAAAMLLTMLPATAMAAEVPADGDLQEAINKAESGDTITVTGNVSSEQPITISNKSLTIVGSGDTKPTIDAIFQIAHTDNGGPYTVTFENLKFAPTAQGNVIAEKSTNATSEENVNKLVIKECEFSLAENQATTRAVVALIATQSDGHYVTGSQLTFQRNTVETTSFASAEGSGYYTVVVSTSATDSTAMYGNDVYNFGKHIISGNTIQGHFYYAYVGGYAEFTNNTVDLKYFTGSDEETDTGARAFQVRGAHADNHGGQLDLTVTGNKFSNMEQLFKLYELDTLLNTETEWVLNIAGSTGEGANTFSGIQELGEAEGSAMAFGNEFSLNDLQEKTWKGITEGKMAIVMADVRLTKAEGDLSTGKMTLDDGKQVTTYTQAIAPESGRTGYYTTIQDVETKYWYFASRVDRPSLHYFVDDQNHFYITYLGGGGSTSALTLTEEDFSDYETASQEVNQGKLYKAGFTINPDQYNNTYYNATVDEATEGVIELSGTANTINAFISNIGSYTTLFVTDREDAAAPDGALKLVVPETTADDKMAQLLVSAAIDVEVDANIENVDIINRCDVTVNKEKNVGKVEIGEAAAVGSALVNNGTITDVDLFAKTDFTNNGAVTNLAVGDDEPGGVARRKETCRLAEGTVINNLGSMENVILYGRATLTNGGENNKTASIQRLTVGSKGLADDETGLPYATDSEIINYGVMCNENSKVEGGKIVLSHDIYLYTKCTFDNYGTIGSEGRTHDSENEFGEDSLCGNVGGVIYIGYYGFSGAHDGLVFTNYGTIHTGARHNGNAHQNYTLFLSGEEGAAAESVSIEIYNAGSGTMTGHVAKGSAFETLKHTLTAYSLPGQTITNIQTEIGLRISADKTELPGGGNVTLTVSGLPAGGKATVTCTNGITVTENEEDGTYTATLPNATETYTFTASYTHEGETYNATCQVSVTEVSSGSSGGSGGSTRYEVGTPDSVENGKVTVSPSRASRGQKVTVTVTPDEGYELAKLTVTDADGKEIELTRVSDTKYTFTMPRGKVEISASFQPVSTTPVFVDVAEGDWYYDAVMYAYENGLMDGVGDSRFAPNSTLNRAMLVTVLWRMAGEPVVNYLLPFEDVAEGQWYTEAVRWAASEGIVNGTSATTYSPMSSITREQMATMLYRYAQYEGLAAVNTAENLGGFTDAGTVSAYAVQALNWAVGQELVNGVGDNLLNPTGSATRAQTATILMRYLENVAD